MTSKRQRLITYGLAIHLLLIAIICYAAFPQKSPDTPIRLMFHTAAGKVFFDHDTHDSANGYGLACIDCHHHPSDEAEALRACGDCHQSLPEGEEFPESCLDCHDTEEIEGSEVGGLEDAFHGQCIKCHSDFEAGPTDCSGCHVI
jgi:hypothetical protein